MQKKLDEDIVQQRGLQHIALNEWIQKETLAMMSELSELIDEVNFKWWKNEKEINHENIKGELIDIFHFFMSMCLKAGMTADEVYERYIDKNKENFDRQYGRSKKEGYSLTEFNKGKI